MLKILIVVILCLFLIFFLSLFIRLVAQPEEENFEWEEKFEQDIRDAFGE